MTTHIKTVSEPFFSLIEKGIKKVEGRLDKGKFSEMKPGDIIVWTNNKDGLGETRYVKTKITSIHKYSSFEKYLRAERLKNTLPLKHIKTINDGCKIYYKFYDKDDEKRYGVLAIRLELV